MPDEKVRHFAELYGSALREALSGEWLTSTDFADLSQIGVPRRAHSRMLAVINDAVRSMGLRPLNEVRVTNASKVGCGVDTLFEVDPTNFPKTQKGNISASFDVVGLSRSDNREAVDLVIEYESIDSDFDLAANPPILAKIEPIVRRLAALRPIHEAPAFARVLIVTLTTGVDAHVRQSASQRKGNRTPAQNDAIAKRARELLAKCPRQNRIALLLLRDQGKAGSELRLEVEIAGAAIASFTIGTPAIP